MEKTITTKAHRELCALLVVAREKAGLRQIDVSQRIGLVQAELSKIENGQRRVEFLLVAKLAKLYQHPIEYFIPKSLRYANSDH